MSTAFKPRREDLQPLMDEAFAGGKKPEEWASEFIRPLVSFLLKDPLRYRGYGPYWWLVKRALIKSGVSDFGDHVDAQLVEMFDYGDTPTNLIAAFAYSDRSFLMGNMLSNSHTIELVGEDPKEYILADDDMELLAIAKQV